MNDKIIAVAVLAVSLTGLAVLGKSSNNVIEAPISSSTKVDAPTKTSAGNEGFLASAYKEQQEEVRKEQSDPAKKAQWAAFAKEFNNPSATCVEKECQ